ncbi:MAG: hypothetical protein ACR2PI_19635 [Hyphomicrobiaceae bacterium]
MTNQRALWTFLFFTLIGPFFAAILAALYTPLAIWANLAPFTAGDHPPFDVGNLPDPAGLAKLMTGAALHSFVWAPIAAAVAGIGLVGLLLTRGEVGWALAGVAGVVGFFVAYVYKPFDAGQLLPAFAAVAGIVAALLSLFLVRINVLPRPS